MSKRGENIYKRKDGRWEARYPKGKDEKGRTKYGYIYAKTYAEAKENLILAKTSNHFLEPCCFVISIKGMVFQP